MCVFLNPRRFPHNSPHILQFSSASHRVATKKPRPMSLALVVVVVVVVEAWTRILSHYLDWETCLHLCCQPPKDQLIAWARHTKLMAWTKPHWICSKFARLSSLVSGLAYTRLAYHTNWLACWLDLIVGWLSNRRPTTDDKRTQTKDMQQQQQQQQHKYTYNIYCNAV